MNKQEMTNHLMDMIFERQKDYPELLHEIKALPVAELTEDEIKIALIASTILRFNNLGGGESVDLAEIINNQLKESSLATPLSSEFIKSIFNFHNIYRPLYDLLDLATNATFQGREMSDEYRLGVIDSIIALRRYERTHGLGDHEWKMIHNTAINKYMGE
jgi:hypothetical protein